MSDFTATRIAALAMAACMALATTSAFATDYAQEIGRAHV